MWVFFTSPCGYFALPVWVFFKRPTFPCGYFFARRCAPRWASCGGGHAVGVRLEIPSATLTFLGQFEPSELPSPPERVGHRVDVLVQVLRHRRLPHAEPVIGAVHVVVGDVGEDACLGVGHPVVLRHPRHPAELGEAVSLISRRPATRRPARSAVRARRAPRQHVLVSRLVPDSSTAVWYRYRGRWARARPARTGPASRDAARTPWPAGRPVASQLLLGRHVLRDLVGGVVHLLRRQRDPARLLPAVRAGDEVALDVLAGGSWSPA